METLQSNDLRKIIHKNHPMSTAHLQRMIDQWGSYEMSSGAGFSNNVNITNFADYS